MRDVYRAVSSEITALQDAHTTHLKFLEDCLTQISSQTIEINRLASDLTGASNASKMAVANAADIEGKLGTLRQQLQDKDNELAQALGSSVANTALLQAEVDTLGREKTNLETQLAQALGNGVANTALLQVEVDTLGRDKTNLETQVNQLKAEVQNAMGNGVAGVAVAEAQLDNLKKEKLSLESQVTRLEAEKGLLNEAVEDAENQFTAIKLQLATETSGLNDKVSHLKRLHNMP